MHSTPFPRRKKPRMLCEQAIADASRELRLAQYEEVLACYQQGLPMAQIAKHLHLSRATIYTYLAAEHFPERGPHGSSPGTGKLIAPDMTYLRERCVQGRDAKMRSSLHGRFRRKDSQGVREQAS